MPIGQLQEKLFPWQLPIRYPVWQVLDNLALMPIIERLPYYACRRQANAPSVRQSIYCGSELGPAHSRGSLLGLFRLDKETRARPQQS